jgi:hypothetical protein
MNVTLIKPLFALVPVNVGSPSSAQGYGRREYVSFAVWLFW